MTHTIAGDPADLEKLLNDIAAVELPESDHDQLLDGWEPVVHYPAPGSRRMFTRIDRTTKPPTVTVWKE